MTLRDRLNSDFKDAMKAKDEIRKNTVMMARAAIKQYEVDNRKELDENGIIELLAKQVKMRKDALAEFEKAGRTDLQEAYKTEIDILVAYLPEQLSEEEIQRIVEQTAAELELPLEKKSMGKLIGGVMPKVKGRADGTVVRNIIENIIK